MKKIIPLVGCSQYSQHVHEKYKASACGPTTAYVITNYLFGPSHTSINDFYELLGSTKIGLFKWRFKRNMRRYLGANWLVADCTIYEALAEIDAGRPVAAKFDKYFTLRFRARALYAYHWVPLIGYDNSDGLKLFIHDNGGRNRESRLRSFYYQDERHVLRFVRITPL